LGGDFWLTHDAYSTYLFKKAPSAQQYTAHTIRCALFHVISLMPIIKVAKDELQPVLEHFEVYASIVNLASQDEED
jgi:hypothetical protein